MHCNCGAVFQYHQADQSAAAVFTGYTQGWEVVHLLLLFVTYSYFQLLH